MDSVIKINLQKDSHVIDDLDVLFKIGRFLPQNLETWKFDKNLEFCDNYKKIYDRIEKDLILRRGGADGQDIDLEKYSDLVKKNTLDLQ
jgi:hypothetical protein